MDNNEELTSIQRARRKYEERNKAERESRVQFGTTLSKKSYDEITAFLEKHNRTKVDLIWAGYFALLEDCGELRQDKK